MSRGGHDDHEHQKKVPDHEKPSRQYEIKWPVFYPVRVEASAEDNERFADEAKARHSQRSLGIWLNFITAGAAVVGLLGLGFLYGQIRVMKGQLSESQTDLRLSQRPWIGVADEPGAFNVGPIVFDENGNASAAYSIKMKNFSSTAGQNIVPNAFLLITEDLKAIAQKRGDVCSEGYVGHSEMDMGYLLFPGNERILEQSASVFPRADMKTPGWNGKFEAWMVGCIGYRDQFGYLYHTAFTYWLVDSSTHRPIEFDVAPNSKITQGTFDAWHSGHFVDSGTPPPKTN